MGFNLQMIINPSRYLFAGIMMIECYLGLSHYLAKDSKDEVKTNGKWMILVLFIGSFIILGGGQQFSNDQMNMFLKIMGLLSIYLLFATSFLSRRFFKSHYQVMTLIAFIQTIGIVMLARLDQQLAYQQLIWIYFGLGIFMFVYLCFRSALSYENMAIPFMILALGFVSLPFFLGVQINGATNWIVIHTSYIDISFQPSEFAKIIFILGLAALYKGQRRISTFFLGTLLSSIMVLILIVQKDLGAAIIFGMIYTLMTYYYVKNELFLLAVFSGIGLIGYLGYQYLGEIAFFNYAKLRFEGWLSPWEHYETTGYQIAQSLAGIAEGGWLGTGLTLGLPEIIPYVTTDFIFAGICEEFGVLSGMGLIFIYCLIVFHVLRVGAKKKGFEQNLLIGFAILLGIQVFIIIGGVIQLIPVTGVTLPFLSYGGSSYISYVAMFAIIIAISLKGEVSEKEEKKRIQKRSRKESTEEKGE